MSEKKKTDVENVAGNHLHGMKLICSGIPYLKFISNLFNIFSLRFSTVLLANWLNQPMRETETERQRREKGNNEIESVLIIAFKTQNNRNSYIYID